MKRSFSYLLLILLTTQSLSAQQKQEADSHFYRYYVGSSVFMVANLFPNSNYFYQLNFGYRITPKDVISLEAITWRFSSPNGIPYGSSYGDEVYDYPGSVREYGIGVVYQRFLWKGLYSSLQALPLKRIYLDKDRKTIRHGFRLFSTFRLGYHLPLFKNRFFIEPSIAATYWPVTSNAPDNFKQRDDRWNKYFLGEPGLHFGFKF